MAMTAAAAATPAAWGSSSSSSTTPSSLVASCSARLQIRSSIRDVSKLKLKKDSLPRAAPLQTIPAEVYTSSPWRTEPAPLPKTQPNEGEKMRQWIETIRTIFRTMRDGQISVSAYDTAWVARVPALDGRAAPQFPESLNWILKHQLQDGSWGDKDLFLAYDRVCSTLACIVALKIWNTGDEIVAKGAEFIRRTMAKMETEDSNHMPIGFEIVFPAMMEEARELGLEIQYDAPVMTKINAEREKKLQRIPMDMLHTYPTTLLHSLEGLHKLVDWEHILKLQSPDGSFLFSPASTACALMYTGNEKSLEYLNNILKSFNGAVPNVYPVDLFEHVWIVDRLERLGIARFFDSEIKETLDYVHRHWTDKGIGWARGSPVQDVDDTAMAFRLLRTHGYQVSPDVFRNFQKGLEFFCFPGQAGQAVTGMYNLYRASQVCFPGEDVLQQAHGFSKSFLEKKQQKNELNDKWIIMKDLPGEVDYALKYPFHATLERVATRKYIDQYGADDVWIGKSLYRMPFVNNNVFLALAKADFNLCQSLHTKELQQLRRWYEERNFACCQFSYEKLVQSYFSAAATIFEPELAPARLTWAQCWFMSAVIKDYFETQGSVHELKKLASAAKRWDATMLAGDCSSRTRLFFSGLQNIVRFHGKQGLMYQGRDITGELKAIWSRWLSCLLEKSEWRASGYQPDMAEYIRNASCELEPAVLSTMYFVGENVDSEGAREPRASKLMNFASSLIQDIQESKGGEPQSCCSSITIYMHKTGSTEAEAVAEIQRLADEQTAELLQETLMSSTLPPTCRQLFLNATRVMNILSTIRAHNSFRVFDKISSHVQQVLFQQAD